MKGLPNTIKTRPDDSPEAHVTNFYNLPNISIAAKILFLQVRFKFYECNTSTILGKEATERVKNQFLASIISTKAAPVNFSIHFHR
jgi:hypothetical protein